MQVILQKTVSNLGLVGDVVDVKPGYFRNFLLPKSLAFVANPGSVKEAAHQKQVVELKKAKEKLVAAELKGQLEKLEVVLVHSAGAGDKLFGSITSSEIALTIKEKGYSIDRKMVLIDGPIKNLGEHILDIKLHPEVIAKVKLTVNRKPGEEIEKAPKEKKAKKKKEEVATEEVKAE